MRRGRNSRVEQTPSFCIALWRGAFSLQTSSSPWAPRAQEQVRRTMRTDIGDDRWILKCTVCWFRGVQQPRRRHFPQESRLGRRLQVRREEDDPAWTWLSRPLRSRSGMAESRPGRTKVEPASFYNRRVGGSGDHPYKPPHGVYNRIV